MCCRLALRNLVALMWAFGMSVLVAAPAEGAPAGLVEALPGLFAGQELPASGLVVQSVRTMRNGNTGGSIEVFEVGDEGRAIGRVACISLRSGEMVAARFAADGSLLGAIQLPQAGHPRNELLDMLCSALTGANPQQDGGFVASLMGGMLAASQSAADEKVKSAPHEAPPVIDFRGKLYPADTPLPELKAVDLNGEAFDLKQTRGKPLILLFVSPTECENCDLMVAAMEKVGTIDQAKGRYRAVYVIAAEKAKAAEYARTHRIQGTIIPDPNQMLMKLLKVPFQPYALMVDEAGVFRYPAFWDNEERFMGIVYLLVEKPQLKKTAEKGD